MEAEGRLVAARGWGWGVGCDCSRAQGFLWGRWECSGSRYRGRMHTTVNVLKGTELCTLKGLVLCEFHLN